MTKQLTVHSLQFTENSSDVLSTVHCLLSTNPRGVA